MEECPESAPAELPDDTDDKTPAICVTWAMYYEQQEELRYGIMCRVLLVVSSANYSNVRLSVCHTGIISTKTDLLLCGCYQKDSSYVVWEFGTGSMQQGMKQWKELRICSYVVLYLSGVGTKSALQGKGELKA